MIPVPCAKGLYSTPLFSVISHGIAEEPDYRGPVRGGGGGRGGCLYNTQYV